MIFTLPPFLPPSLLAKLAAAFNEGTFVDGIQTAGSTNNKRKKNEEIQSSSALRKELSVEFRKALFANNDFGLIAQPKHIGDMLLSRYRDGMFYGDHVDNTIMGLASGNPWRSDLSFTLFLSDPESYDGGELALNTDIRPESIKLPAGHMVIYSTLALHRVNPVTRGERRAAVGWAQSFVRDPNQRQILLDIAQTLGFLQDQLTQGTEHSEAIRLQKVYANLSRMWSEV
ncbi:MAG: Fe2+-dependent dioxygenase [Alphaproteobacteria bacterium]